MREYHGYWEAVKGNPEKMEKLTKIVDKMHDKLKKHCPSEYYDMLAEMHCAVYGPHFDEHTAKMAVADMHNVDGTEGEHWTMEQTNPIADQQGITNKCDFYYIMNMLWSDYYKVLGNDANLYIKMAKAYMEDPDGIEGKPFRMWLAQMRYRDKE